MKRDENQTVEYKESWHEKYLEWVCGYANAKGGTLYIGIEDGTNLTYGLTKEEIVACASIKFLFPSLFSPTPRLPLPSWRRPS